MAIRKVKRQWQFRRIRRYWALLSRNAGQEVGDLNAVRAARSQRIPTVLTQDEGRRVLSDVVRPELERQIDGRKELHDREGAGRFLAPVMV